MFCSRNVIDVAHLLTDEAMKNEMLLLSYIRNLSLNTLCSCPGYKKMTLQEKNENYTKICRIYKNIYGVK